MTAGVAGTTKKFAFSAAYQLGYAVGNIIGPQTYRADDAPNYYVSIRSFDMIAIEESLLTICVSLIRLLSIPCLLSSFS